jgi:thioredoxin reductase (NADPH)
VSEDDLPIVVDGERVFRNATVEQLADVWGESKPPPKTDYDLAIVGAGPAGLAAAVYAASDGLDTVVLERDVPGGQASHTSRIENFFGFPGGIGGAELARLAGRQAEGFGAHLSLLRPVVGSDRTEDGQFELRLAGGHTVRAPVVIAAPGMEWRKLDADGFEEQLGRGAYYGAGRSEAAQCTGDPVVVVGAGNSAGQAAMFFSSHARSVTIVSRGDTLEKSMSRYLIDQLATRPNIEVRFNTELVAAHGSASLEAIDVRDNATGETERVESGGVFIFIGADAETDWLPPEIALDPKGYVLTGSDVRAAGRWEFDRDPYLLETSVAGIFACGDVRFSPVKRVAAAVGEGSMAIAFVHQYLRDEANPVPAQR